MFKVSKTKNPEANPKRNPYYEAGEGMVDSLEDLEGEFSYAGREIIPPPWDREGDMQVTTGGGAVLRNPANPTRTHKHSHSHMKAGNRRYHTHLHTHHHGAKRMRHNPHEPVEPFFNRDQSGGLYSEGPPPARMGGRHLFDQRMPLALDALLSNPDSINRGNCPSCGVGVSVPADVVGGDCPNCGKYVEVSY